MAVRHWIPASEEWRVRQTFVGVPGKRGFADLRAEVNSQVGIIAMLEQRDMAIAMAKEYMASQHYKHGPCIGAKCKSSRIPAMWDVEFAHEGLTSRSDTTDPTSIVLIVDLDQNSIRVVDIM